jgi:hypothetical protein
MKLEHDPFLLVFGIFYHYFTACCSIATPLTQKVYIVAVKRLTPLKKRRIRTRLSFPAWILGCPKLTDLCHRGRPS